MKVNKNELRKSVQQALFYISQGRPVPEDNTLLASPLVLHYLQQQQRTDDPDTRQEALQEILKEQINQYAVEEPEGKRKQEMHKLLFDVMQALIQGKYTSVNDRNRTYQRYHARAIDELSQRWDKERLRLESQQSGSDPPELYQARRSAEEISLRLKQRNSGIDILSLIELLRAASIIQHYNYYIEAKEYYYEVVDKLQRAPSNLIVLNQRAQAVTGLAHCLMNSDDVYGSINQFLYAVQLASILDDTEKRVHSIHMLGVAYGLAHNNQESLLYLEKALYEARGIRDRTFRTAWIKRDKIRVLIEKGDFAEISSLASSSLAMRERLDDEQGYMLTLQIWARALIKQGDYKDAEKKLLEALHLMTSTPSKLFHTMLYLELANLYASMGKIDTLREYVDMSKSNILKYGLWHQLHKLERIVQSNNLMQS